MGRQMSKAGPSTPCEETPEHGVEQCPTAPKTPGRWASRRDHYKPKATRVVSRGLLALFDLASPSVHGGTDKSCRIHFQADAASSYTPPSPSLRGDSHAAFLRARYCDSNNLTTAITTVSQANAEAPPLSMASISSALQEVLWKREGSSSRSKKKP